MQFFELDTVSLHDNSTDDSSMPELPGSLYPVPRLSAEDTDCRSLFIIFSVDLGRTAYDFHELTVKIGSVAETGLFADNIY